MTGAECVHHYKSQVFWDEMFSLNWQISAPFLTEAVISETDENLLRF